MNFWYLFSAYTIIWLVLFGYLLKLGRANRRLRKELEALQEAFQHLSSKRKEGVRAEDEHLGN